MFKAHTCLKIIALLLALILAIQDFGSFFIDRPTTAVLASNKLTLEKFPDTILCPYPGYDFSHLQSYGFKGFDGYLFGILEGTEDIVNFSGKLERDPANISEDILLVKNLGDIVYRIEATLLEESSKNIKREPEFKQFAVEEKINYMSQYVLTGMGFCFRFLTPNPEPPANGLGKVPKHLKGCFD